MVLINTLDKNVIITYNIDINKNRGVGVEDNKDKRFYSTKLFLILVICWVFLKIGSDIHKWQKFDEANEQASKRASERASEHEKTMEKLRQEFREKWGEEPSF